MSEQSETYTDRMRRFVGQLYDQQDTVRQVLGKLDLSWKLGEDIHLEIVLDRFEALMAFFNYVTDSKQIRVKTLDEWRLSNTPEADFLDSLADRFSELGSPFFEHLYNLGGIRNHLQTFSPEGIFYDPERKIVFAQFSVFTQRTRLMQVKDRVDDIIWLSGRLIYLSNRALKACTDSNSPLSQIYINVLRERFDVLEKAYLEFRDQLNSFPKENDAEPDTSSIEVRSDLTEEREGYASVPDVDLGSTE